MGCACCRLNGCDEDVLMDPYGRMCLCGHERFDHRSLPIHRTEAGYPHCSTCDGGGCPDCTDPA